MFFVVSTCSNILYDRMAGQHFVLLILQSGFVNNLKVAPLENVNLECEGKFDNILITMLFVLMAKTPG